MMRSPSRTPSASNALVLQVRDLLAVVVIAYPALERGEAAAMRVDQLIAQLDAIDGRVGKAEGAHPPATGGMKTTVSPAFSGRDQSENSALTATFRWSGDSVNGAVR